MNFLITKHALDRAKERLDLKRESVEDMLFQASTDGWYVRQIKDIYPKVYKYFERSLEGKDSDRILLYKHCAFILLENKVLTILRIPRPLRRDSKSEYKEKQRQKNRKQKKKDHKKSLKACKWWNQLTKEQRKEYNDGIKSLTTEKLVELYENFAHETGHIIHPPKEVTSYANDVVHAEVLYKQVLKAFTICNVHEGVREHAIRKCKEENRSELIQVINQIYKSQKK